MAPFRRGHTHAQSGEPMAERLSAKPQNSENGLGPAQKVAALLLAMGKSTAGRILKHFDEAEIKQIAQSTTTLGTISKATLESIVEEFTRKFSGGGELQGSLKEAEELLSTVVPPEKVAEILPSITGESDLPVWPRLQTVPDATLFQYLAKEHPQIIAFILSKAPAGAGAMILRQFAPEVRNEIMRRMLSIKQIMDPALRLLESTLRDDLLRTIARRAGGDVHSKIATIINKMDREQIEQILRTLAESRPKEAQAIKGLLFRFEDLAKLTPSDRTKLLDALTPDRITLALVGVDDELKNLVLSSVPGRARRMIEADLQSGAPVEQKEVIKARRAIADLALDMAERGMIVLNPEEAEEIY